MNRLSSWERTGCALLMCAATAIGLSAETFATLANFSEGAAGPLYVSLVQGADGAFYGTVWGGTADNGSIFKVTTAGALTTLYGFSGADGSQPYAGVVLATDGNFYGTADVGGAYGVGTFFKMTPAGVLTTLLSFSPSINGAGNPNSGVIQATNGNFYGTAEAGAAGCCGGAIYRVTSAGQLTILYDFGGGVNGSTPYAGLVQATNGNFYGVTTNGVIFKMTPAGNFTTLHYDPSEGAIAPLIQASNGNFYGAALAGGAYGKGAVFRITPSGSFTTIYSFCALSSCADGAGPYGALVQGTDGNFYGTTSLGGDATCQCGTIFKMTPNGTLTTLHSFVRTDGATPQGGLVQGTDGTFYGTTTYGGTGNVGVVFSMSVGLGPFVRTVPTSAYIGTVVQILGTNLTGATSVKFNGTGARFAVTSASEITTRVPAGATTGNVQVTTPGGTLTSNVPFRVRPVILSFSPPNGPVGTAVTITGQSFTGATTVTFGGVKATSFTVDSYTQITATVPAGAVTGKISVTTPGGTATSGATFTVD